VIIQKEKCLNANHWRLNPPVRYCPICGEVVNEKISKVKCTEDKHARERLGRSKYCVDCGQQLNNEG